MIGLSPGRSRPHNFAQLVNDNHILLHRASATVKIPPIPDGETWQIGWIQACTDMVFMNTYGPYGISSWEFPELKTGMRQTVVIFTGAGHAMV